jgi:HEAT repeat protein
MGSPMYDHPGGAPGFIADLKSLSHIESCVDSELRDALQSEAWDILDRYVTAAYYHPSARYVTSLGAAMANHDKDLSFEDVAEALGATREPSAVKFLVDALKWNPDWDEYHHFAIKCVRALGVIGDSLAIDALREATSTGPKPVRDAALAELRKLIL